MLGHGIDYQYPHNFDGAWVKQQYLPDELIGETYYLGNERDQVKRRDK